MCEFLHDVGHMVHYFHIDVHGANPRVNTIHTTKNNNIHVHGYLRVQPYVPELTGRCLVASLCQPREVSIDLLSLLPRTSTNMCVVLRAHLHLRGSKETARSAT